MELQKSGVKEEIYKLSRVRRTEQLASNPSSPLLVLVIILPIILAWSQ